ncbi:Cms1p ASCRUDRAFT_72568 [Ascoidea rubescens DSM 1968]|uniref:Uncharacterized protein n=1 Tax=Ascoidea rubescens DSM 1968 TaxID=1344418 RepID=A0A1D2VAA3_9ASCO|nr:hypothetical protein ASCRUDRAFT_72568 [Ascoidea rubescens DSM 1968]ODV58387.1 hypothetical protein ASCRUDRAFT_72568 [Ascoidea rubescens DSM 1968]
MTQMKTAADELDDGLEYSFDDIVHEASEEVIDDNEKTIGDKEKENKRVENDKKTTKKRRRKNGKLELKKKQKVDQEKNMKKNICKENEEIICEYLNKKISQDNKNEELSTLELSEKFFNKRTFHSTSEFAEPLARNLDNYSQFIDKYAKREKLVVVLAASNIRCCDIVRSIKSLRNSRPLKLLSKNKLKNDVASLNSIVQSQNNKQEAKKDKERLVLIATPTRFVNVLKQISDREHRLKFSTVVIDGSYLDPKSRSIFDLSVNLELFKELSVINEEVVYYLY